MPDIHPALLQDCLVIGRFPLCTLLLMDDVTYPWFILVPEREAMTEIHQLCEADQQQLMRESVQLAKALEAAFTPDKLNVAVLGNIVPQLHFHHVVRYRNDPAWPGPVWGQAPAIPYGKESRGAVLAALKTSLGDAVEWRATNQLLIS